MAFVGNLIMVTLFGSSIYLGYHNLELSLILYAVAIALGTYLLRSAPLMVARGLKTGASIVFKGLSVRVLMMGFSFTLAYGMGKAFAQYGINYL